MNREWFVSRLKVYAAIWLVAMIVVAVLAVADTIWRMAGGV